MFICPLSDVITFIINLRREIMRKKVSAALFITLILFSVSGITIKMASPLPEGSEWHRTLLSMAEDWNRITEGRVKLRIFPGGIAGTGEEVVRRMRIGQIDMAVFTASTLASIVPDTFVMSTPFYLDTEEELDHMLAEMSPVFDETFTEKGFRMLSWSKSGWMYIYSTEKVRTPDEVRRLKFAISPEDQAAIKSFKAIGFNIIPLDVNDILMGLQGGMIESFYTSPLAAASFQWFGLAPYMIGYRIAPLIGGITISERAWRRIPARYYEELQESTDRMTRDFYQRAREMENRALDTMTDYGLEIVEISESQKEQWESIMGRDFSAFAGEDKVIGRDIFNKYRTVLEEFRSTGGE